MPGGATEKASVAVGYRVSLRSPGRGSPLSGCLQRGRRLTPRRMDELERLVRSEIR